MKVNQIDILNGNELIVKGALESGFSLYTGYPGSPLADYFNILHAKRKDLEKKGIKVVIANSEANAAAMASGAKQAGRDCIVAMKSMGLHVASDALSVGNFANPGETRKNDLGQELSPAVVVVVGDDPWSISTSTPADSRYLFKHLHIPFLEPSTPQELKDWIAKAKELSARSSVYTGLLLTTFMAEGGGRVNIYDDATVSLEKVNLDPSEFNLQKNVMVPPNSLFADKSMIEERFPKVLEVLEELSLDKGYGNKSSKIGLISSGAIFETLKQVLEEGNSLNSFFLYKLASSFPLIEKNLVTFLKGLDHLVVVEEKRGFLEGEIKELIQKHGLKTKVYGKKFEVKDKVLNGFPAYGGLDYEIIRERLEELFFALNVDCHNEFIYKSKSLGRQLPRRLPTFCPGCPHRETLSLLKELRKDLKGKGVNLISHGDVGCYSLSFLEPFKEMHNLSAMGQGGALGAGVDLFTVNPSIVLMGDSTFFHSGLTDISNSVQLGHNITYILLDNDNTAMTGHQMTPSSGVSVSGQERPKQRMAEVAKSLGVKEVLEVNPSDRYFYKTKLSELIGKEGVKVIVSNKECGLTFQAKLKAKEREVFPLGQTQAQRSFFQINTQACEDCRVCVEMTGCPGLGQTFDAYGSKLMIDPNICVSDGYCTKLSACPSFEEVVVKDYHPTLYKSKRNLSEEFDRIPLPEVVKSFDAIAAGADFRVVVTGVGGTGVTTISKVLSQAAKEMGGRENLDFKFVDQKGLAQRNGRVTGHLSIFSSEKSQGAITPKGAADLVLSPDLLDGSVALEFLSESGLAIFDENFQLPLSILLDYETEEESLKEAELIKLLESEFGDQVVLAKMKLHCSHFLGKAVYASAFCLGMAFQSGRLPFSLDDMRVAFTKSTRAAELENNWKAFNLGRKVYLGDIYNIEAEEEDKSLLQKSLVEGLAPWESKKSILEKFTTFKDKLRVIFPKIKDEYLDRYIYDLLVYDRGKNVQSFLENCLLISKNLDSELHEMGLRTLVRTYFVKDEVFVAHEMISLVLRKRDDEKYLALGRSYSKRRINKPRFEVFGKEIEFDLSPSDGMLKVMRHCRFLRPLLPSWHKKEREISRKIRKELVSKSHTYKSLKALENIKGYREVRYEKEANTFS